jgi:glycosyltransferase involved in cell wall biosynthesis
MTEKKLKICYISSMHDWNDDRIFERAAVGLVNIGHDVCYIASADGDFISNGVQIFGIKKRSRFGKHLFGPIEAYLRMKHVKADIYHFHNPNMMLLMVLWAKKGYKVYFDIHENYESRVHKLPLPGFIIPICVRLYRRIENWCCGFFEGVTVVTNSMKNKITDSGTPILILDNVPYISRLKNINLSDDKFSVPTIITSGIHSSARNCIQAVEALPDIVKDIPDIQMLFVGRFQPTFFEAELHIKAKQLGVSKNLKTEGMLPWHENFKRISKAHIGCVFYEDNLNNKFTLPNRLYEYMFCGLVVLGEDFPEVRAKLIDSQCGLTVNSTDPRSIAQGVKKIFKDKYLLKKYSSNARKAIETQYNFENALIQLNIFYHDPKAF